jgi:hypothetical protein
VNVRKRIFALPIVALAVGLIAAAPAQAHNHGAVSAPTTQLVKAVTARSAQQANSAPLFLTAKLSGAQEVPIPGGPAVGDDDGRATALVRVKGSQVKFSLQYKGITTPTLGHIHQGKAGINGDVKVTLFGTPLPATVTAAAGAVTVDDPAIADAIREDPTGFYVNLHSNEFPGGAVRGQLAPLQNRVDLFKVVRGGKLHAFLSGDQEVPVAGGPAVGDPNGRAVAFIRPMRTSLNYSLAFVGFTPTLGHIHQGKVGTNGPIKVVLMDTAVPATIIAVAGTVSDVDAGVVRQIRRTPSDFYVNLHSAEFPGGAVRGQLFR